MKNQIIGKVSLEALKEIIEVLENQEEHMELNKRVYFLGLESEFFIDFDKHGNAKIKISKLYES